MKRTKWVVVLPWRSFYMVGEPCTEAEANAYVQSIWPAGYVE